MELSTFPCPGMEVRAQQGPRTCLWWTGQAWCGNTANLLSHSVVGDLLPEAQHEACWDPPVCQGVCWGDARCSLRMTLTQLRSGQIRNQKVPHSEQVRYGAHWAGFPRLWGMVHSPGPCGWGATWWWWAFPQPPQGDSLQQPAMLFSTCGQHTASPASITVLLAPPPSLCSPHTTHTLPPLTTTATSHLSPVALPPPRC